MLRQLDVLWGGWFEIRGGQGLAVNIDPDVGDRGVDGRLEMLTPTLGIATADMDGHLHGTLIGSHHPGIHLDEITDGDRVVEADPAGVHSNGVIAGPFHGAGRTGFIDPFHRGSTVDLATPVDVCGLGQEPGDQPWGEGWAVVGLLLHLRLDGATQIDTG